MKDKCKREESDKNLKIEYDLQREASFAKLDAEDKRESLA